MALHQKTERSEKHRQANHSKPSRAKRHAARYDARVKMMNDFLVPRNAAWDRALRISAYLNLRAARRAMKAVA